MKFKIYPELIGTIPAVEFLRREDALFELILRYELAAPIKPQDLTPESIAAYVEETWKNPVAIQKMADGVAIELAATHFFGLKGEDFNSMADLIAAMDQLARAA